MILENIRQLCKNKGITLSHLERELGFGNSAIVRWENSSPTVRNLQKVANYFGCSVDDLLREDVRDVFVPQQDQTKN